MRNRVRPSQSTASQSTIKFPCSVQRNYGACCAESVGIPGSQSLGLGWGAAVGGTGWPPECPPPGAGAGPIRLPSQGLRGCAVVPMVNCGVNRGVWNVSFLFVLNQPIIGTRVCGSASSQTHSQIFCLGLSISDRGSVAEISKSNRTDPAYKFATNFCCCWTRPATD